MGDGRFVGQKAASGWRRGAGAEPACWPARRSDDGRTWLARLSRWGAEVSGGDGLWRRGGGGGGGARWCRPQATLRTIACGVRVLVRAGVRRACRLQPGAWRAAYSRAGRQARRGAAARRRFQTRLRVQLVPGAVDGQLTPVGTGAVSRAFT